MINEGLNISLKYFLQISLHNSQILVMSCMVRFGIIRIKGLFTYYLNLLITWQFTKYISLEETNEKKSKNVDKKLIKNL